MAERQHISMRINVALWKRVRRRALDDGLSASGLVEAALVSWMIDEGTAGSADAMRAKAEHEAKMGYRLPPAPLKSRAPTPVTATAGASEPVMASPILDAIDIKRAGVASERSPRTVRRFGRLSDAPENSR